MGTSGNEMNLGEFHVGARIIVRSRVDWRTAVVSRRVEDLVTLSIASPTGYNYRIRRNAEMRVELDGQIPVLHSDLADNWKDNFSRYDVRW